MLRTLPESSYSPDLLQLLNQCLLATRWSRWGMARRPIGGLRLGAVSFS